MVQSVGFEVAGPAVAYEDFGADAVLLNLETGVYFSIADRAKAFLGELLTANDGPAFLRALSERDAEAGEMAHNTLEKLLNEGLVRTRETPETDTNMDAKVDAVLAGKGGFSFDSFSDLADVIAADPIHDFSPETGLPVAANA